jgi:hypothetical protein
MSEIHVLTIRFRGICTHFRNVVPGVPHRVVLPRTESIRFGIVHCPPPAPLPPPPKPPTYYLTPHFALLSTKGGPIPNIDGILQSAAHTGNPLIDLNNSYLIGAARIQVANPVNDVGQPTYLPSYAMTKSLREFVPDYEYSEEVVQGGRATCYFDIFNGEIESGLTDGGASSASVTMLTDGPPKLVVMPIQPLTAGAEPHSLTLAPDTLGVAKVTLTVGNLELNSSEADDRQFDYLMHYLTADGGIPRVLAKWTPGMTNPQPQNAEQFADGIKGFANLINPSITSDEGPPTLFLAALLGAIAKINTEDATPSCSDSRYP